MQEINFLDAYQKATERDYVGRVTGADKAACAEIAKQWGRDYWDGDRKHGYGGYRYDGRWRPVAEAIARHYGLKAGDRILDVGCGKAFLLYELTLAVPGIEVSGLDISEYAITHGKEEVRARLRVGDAATLPWPDDNFDFVYSVNTLHNLGTERLSRAVREIQRVSSGRAWICVESFRSEREKVNLLYWQLTCESFHRPQDWTWLLGQWGYTGDVGFIFFE